MELLVSQKLVTKIIPSHQPIDLNYRVKISKSKKEIKDQMITLLCLLKLIYQNLFHLKLTKYNNKISNQ